MHSARYACSVPGIGHPDFPPRNRTICPAQAFHPTLEGQMLTLRLVDGRGREQTLRAALVCDAGREALP